MRVRWKRQHNRQANREICPIRGQYGYNLQPETEWPSSEAYIFMVLLRCWVPWPLRVLFEQRVRDHKISEGGKGTIPLALA